MPSVRKSHRKNKSQVRKRSAPHHASRKKSTTHGGARKHSTPKRSRAVQKGGGETAKFWCMKCKNFSKSPIDRYEMGRGGGRFAKGRCKNCDTKVSLIVKSEEPKANSR